MQPLHLPGYIAFTHQVNKALLSSKYLFLKMALLYALLTALLVGMASQDLYTTLSETLRSTTGDIFNGAVGQIGEAGILLLTGITGGLTQNLSESQQILAIFISLLIWLSTVYLLRNKLAGNKLKLRDAVYSSSAPLIPTLLITLLAVIQLLPIAIGLIVYTAASVSGLIDGGAAAMLVWVGIALLVVISLYLLTSTFMSLIVVTLPGMYPLQAIRTGSELVKGRRLRVLYRLLWMTLMIALFWIITLVPIIIFDAWLKGVIDTIDWLPIVPVSLLIVSSLTVVWTAGYVYLLYRKIVDDVAKQS